MKKSQQQQQAQFNYQTEAESQNVTTICGLCKAFAYRSSAHGLPRIAGSREKPRRFMWFVVVFSAVCGFTYHASFLITNYLSYPRTTTTEEKNADKIDFPAVTICNLNPLKKKYFEEHMKVPSDGDDAQVTESPFFAEPMEEEGFCFKTYDDFLKKSRTMDLSDMWLNLVTSKQALIKYGHQVQDLLVQCTYNNKNCYTYTNTTVIDEIPFPSPRFGLCHTLIVSAKEDREVTKTGSPYGLRLTLNIERDMYVDMISPEYGIRLLVHPSQEAPSVDRGGVVLYPGTKTFVSLKMRTIERLPEPYRGCTETFARSKLMSYLKILNQDHLLENQTWIYTFDHCQTFCKEARLMSQCGCMEELSEGDTSCDPCNSTQVKCRANFMKSFTRAGVTSTCQKICRPACKEVRFDMTVSQAEWPNIKTQNMAMKRWPTLNQRMNESMRELFDNDTILNATLLEKFRENFLRVHIFLQDKNYLSITDQADYPLPKLFADLGGCLGLYIGVSAITIVEIMEQLVNILVFVYIKHRRPIPTDILQRAARRIALVASRRIDPPPPSPPIVDVRTVPTQFPEISYSSTGQLDQYLRMRSAYSRADTLFSQFPLETNRRVSQQLQPRLNSRLSHEHHPRRKFDVSTSTTVDYLTNRDDEIITYVPRPSAHPFIVNHH